MEIKVYEKILKANDVLAAANREKMKSAGVTSFNLISSPGTGKTTLLEKTLERLAGRVACGVIEGDVQTDRDARRLQQYQIPVVQINTDGGCHLDANMVAVALADFPLVAQQLLFIENVGNLVCPAGYDLGTDGKIVLLSVPEGDDKPAKYPAAIVNAAVVVLTKIDLLPYCNFNEEKFWEDIANVNAAATRFTVSAATGAGMDEWIVWLGKQVKS